MSARRQDKWGGAKTKGTAHIEIQLRMGNPVELEFDYTYNPPWGGDYTDPGYPAEVEILATRLAKSGTPLACSDATLEAMELQIIENGG